MKQSYDYIEAHANLFGNYYVNQQKSRDPKVAPFFDGKRYWSRREIELLGCSHIGAARNVSRLIQDLKITIRDFFKMKGSDVADIKGFGQEALNVIIAIGNAQGIETEAWAAEAGVTFNTLKQQANRRRQLDQKTEKRETKKQKALRQAGDVALTNGEAVSTTRKRHLKIAG